MVVNKKNPFAYKAKQAGKKKTSGKRVGKSRPEKTEVVTFLNTFQTMLN